jgi:hypothetical protein
MNSLGPALVAGAGPGFVSKVLFDRRTATIERGGMKRISASCVVAGALLLAGRAWAATQVLGPSDDTFINSINPNNNNGASLSFFTGTDGHNGNMHGLLRFGLPAGLQGRATVSAVALTLTVHALGDGTAGTPAVESLRAVTEAWVQGNGIGNAVMSFTVGQTCGGTVVGATWNDPSCATGIGWATPGGTVVATVSGQADTTGIPVDGQLVWSSAAPANAQMVADVQGWLDSPAGNHGWRISSSTEGIGNEAQRFYSTEAGTSAPTLSVTYACKAGFVASGNDCVATTSVPAVGPAGVGLLAALLLAAATLKARLRPR